MSVVEFAPVVKTLELRRSAADVFRMYVHEGKNWWPLESHSLSPSNNTKAIDLIVEPHVGGRVYEVTEDGRTFDWGEVLAYEPGARFSMTWQLGAPRAHAGDVDVRFEPTSETSCRLTLTHTGWERMPEKARETRDGYEQGWGQLLGEIFRNYAA